jgi:hypothetical protein
MIRIFFSALLLCTISAHTAYADFGLLHHIDDGQTGVSPHAENLILAAGTSKRAQTGRVESPNNAFGRVQPIYNVETMTVLTGSRKPATAQQIRDAIITGATAKRWQVREVGEGHLVAQIFVRSHMAEVDITYDATSYSITYKDSTNLRYDGTLIHRNYNKWIALMVGQINPVIRSY